VLLLSRLHLQRVELHIYFSAVYRIHEKGVKSNADSGVYIHVECTSGSRWDADGLGDLHEQLTLLLRDKM
jgi:hypothetical protein